MLFKPLFKIAYSHFELRLFTRHYLALSNCGPEVKMFAYTFRQPILLFVEVHVRHVTSNSMEEFFIYVF